MTSKRTTKKLHRCPQRWATPTPELELTPELTLFYSELEWLTPGVPHLWSVGVQISIPIYPVSQYLILIFILEYVVGMVKL
jgi:hypothetical protein